MEGISYSHSIQCGHFDACMLAGMEWTNGRMDRCVRMYLCLALPLIQFSSAISDELKRSYVDEQTGESTSTIRYTLTLGYVIVFTI